MLYSFNYSQFFFGEIGELARTGKLDHSYHIKSTCTRTQPPDLWSTIQVLYRRVQMCQFYIKGKDSGKWKTGFFRVNDRYEADHVVFDQFRYPASYSGGTDVKLRRQES